MTSWNAATAATITTLATQHPSTASTVTQQNAWSATSVWHIVADNLTALSFTGYTAGGQSTTTAA